MAKQRPARWKRKKELAPEVNYRNEKGQYVEGAPGRPRGARNKIAQLFLTHLYRDWLDHGAAAIKRMRETYPTAYVKVVASLVPKTFEIKDDAFEKLSDDELVVLIADVRKLLDIARQSGIGAPATTH